MGHICVSTSPEWDSKVNPVWDRKVGTAQVTIAVNSIPP